MFALLIHVYKIFLKPASDILYFQDIAPNQILSQFESYYNKVFAYPATLYTSCYLHYFASSITCLTYYLIPDNAFLIDQIDDCNDVQDIFCILIANCLRKSHFLE